MKIYRTFIQDFLIYDQLDLLTEKTRPHCISCLVDLLIFNTINSGLKVEF